MNPVRRIALLGFGEVGQRLACDLRHRTNANLFAYDPKFEAPGSTPKRALGRLAFVRATDTARDAAAGSDLIISAVTAAEAVAAARSVVGTLNGDACFLDLNSIAPTTRELASSVIEGAGGCYVEAAVMSAIDPRGIESPMLLGGRFAESRLDFLQSLGFTGASFCSGQLGQASATKMCRSILVKGLEALLTEALLTARHFDVGEAVLDSLQDLLPAEDWPGRAKYMIARSVEHGIRRAEEMREVVRTVSAAGIEPLMSRACTERQSWAASFPSALDQASLDAMLDDISQQLGQEAR
ncbi:MAG: DUF1932 domain-containing protein [Xanthomonadales bacterium]|nr:DUF1932 domain-containing protein [Xanthomonadales bacterium]